MNAWHLLQENEANLKILNRSHRLKFRKIASLLTTSALLTVKAYFAYQVNGINDLYKKKCFSEKMFFENIRPNFLKNHIFVYSFVIDGRRIVDILGEGAYFSLHTNIIIAYLRL